MTDRPGCAETRRSLPELAAGVAPAEERARALRHLATCGRCHRELEGHTALIDELLQLVPERQPPAGFEAAVLAPVLRRGRKRRVRGAVLVAASIVLAAVLAGGLVWRQTADDRRVAESYRQTLAVAHGQYMRTVPVGGTAEAGGPGEYATAPSGYVFAYQGSPAWLFVTMTAPSPSGSYQVGITTREGRQVSLGTMAVRNYRGAWGTTVPVAVHDILVMRFSASTGGDLLARFSS